MNNKNIIIEARNSLRDMYCECVECAVGSIDDYHKEVLIVKRLNEFIDRIEELNWKEKGLQANRAKNEVYKITQEAVGKKP